MPYEIISAIISVVVALVVSIQQAPMLRDRIRRWYQIKWLSPREGELAILIEPPFEDVEALIFRVSRTMFPASRVPINEIMVIIGIDGDTATVVWNGHVALLPRRWLRRPKI